VQGELVIQNLSLSRTQTYHIAITVPHFLRRVMRNITLGNEKITFPNLLAGDLTNNQSIGPLDWEEMKNHWGTNNTLADINKDGIVNSIDFTYINKNWLKVGE